MIIKICYKKYQKKIINKDLIRIYMRVSLEVMKETIQIY